MTGFLLQSRFDTQFVEQADTRTIILAAVLVGIFVLVLVIAGLSSSRKRRQEGDGGAPQKYRKGAFRRRASGLGLNKTHIRTLEYVRKRFNVKKPYSLLTSQSYLDFYLNKAINEIDSQAIDDEIKEGRKLTLYRIKQVIERNSSKSSGFQSTKQLKTSQPVSLSVEGSPRYQSRVLGVLKDGVAVQVPASEKGTQVRWKKWSPVQVFFWKPNGEGFSFSSKVTGYNNFRGTPAVLLQHSSSIRSAKQRRFRRKEIETPCYVYPVRVLTSGRGKNQQKKAYVDTRRRILGTLLEVSAGGCSIRGTKVLEKGTLAKVEFETGRGNTIAPYGKIVNTRKENAMSYVMHVMFTRVSKKNLNKINAFVYELGKPSPVKV